MPTYLGDDRENSAYCDAGLRADSPVEKFTVYVEYRFGEAEDDTEVEELDVVAVSDRHAREIATLALKRDYEPGGKIVHVEERVRGTLYL